MTYRCSFCGKSQDQVQRLLAGPGGGVYICGECVGLCREIIEEEIQSTGKRLGSIYMGQQWEYCELSQLGSNVTVRFYGRNLPSCVGARLGATLCRY